MAAHRASLNAAELRRMARIVREEGVALHGRVDPLGNLSFKLSPIGRSKAEDGDDLDDRLAAFGGQ